MRPMIMVTLTLLLLISSPANATERQSVLGFGGFFFKAENPAELAKWYEQHLGVKRTPSTYEEMPWQQEGGSTVFGVFKNTTSYFGRTEQQWMLNFRVADLDAMVAQLREAGISVEVDPESYPNGRFARLQDPEGNPIQLWQEKAPH
ncbi:VOC family protein [Pseudidiomarina mangrovi]|uniref:VOC family protein n=1 Tax=Pseudidiomarina mangrovi TaxID=2487133 RepID=UPI001F0BFDB0|nr:VOC family protein [Pseudidiomarina mangrovi]